MEENILNGGIEGLQLLRDKLVQLDRYQNDNSLLNIDEKKLEKSIVSKEAAIEEELNLTIKKEKKKLKLHMIKKFIRLKNK